MSYISFKVTSSIPFKRKLLHQVVLFAVSIIYIYSDTFFNESMSSKCIERSVVNMYHM